MSENTEVVVETSNELEDTPQDNQVSGIEQRALDMGWRPRDEFDGSDDDFIDAKEFVRRKPLFDKIEHQSKEIKNVRKAVEAWKQHYSAVEKASYNKALAELKNARTEAISNADGDKFEAIDTEIKRVEAQVDLIQRTEAMPAVPDEPQVHPEFAAWTNKNQWYSSVSYMRKFADEYGLKLANEGTPRDQVLKQVEQAVRKEFPHKFTNPNKTSAPDVESGGNASRGTPRSERMELSDVERKIMNTLVSSGQMTKEKYLADLKAIKGIK